MPGVSGQIGPLIAAGVLGFKAFLCHSGIDEFPNATEADLRAVMPELARAGVPLLVHAELTGPAPIAGPDDGRPNAAATPASRVAAAGMGARRDPAHDRSLPRVSAATSISCTCRRPIPFR